MKGSSGAHRAVVTKQSSSRFRFIGETIAELKKVVWLKRPDIIRLTGIVLAVAITAGILLGAFDFGFAQLVNKLLLGG
ncbi:MAG: preprotein translocase subunit SecE [Dehalococcoidales bacterium]|jgi:preprotein translocase SecE subunit|nr:preprotein translocase subunit SecE [Dehalococcoidales bacterium]|tara:strand:- start:66 stop:299 length:234 start_codon:yes stop_codon:yes gene_type:complete